MAVAKTIRTIAGRLLAYAGAAVFLFGDKAVNEFKHLDYVLSLMIAIGAAVVLFVFAYAIGFRPKGEADTEEP